MSLKKEYAHPANDVRVTLEAIPHVVQETQERLLNGRFRDEDNHDFAITVYLARDKVQEDPLKAAYELLITLHRGGRYVGTIIKASGKMTVTQFKANWYFRLDATSLEVETFGPILVPLDDDDIPVLSKYTPGGTARELQRIMAGGAQSGEDEGVHSDMERKRRAGKEKAREEDEDPTREITRSLSNVSWDDLASSAPPSKEIGISAKNSPFASKRGASKSPSVAGSSTRRQSQVPTLLDKPLWNASNKPPAPKKQQNLQIIVPPPPPKTRSKSKTKPTEVPEEEESRSTDP